MTINDFVKKNFTCKYDWLVQNYSVAKGYKAHLFNSEEEARKAAKNLTSEAGRKVQVFRREAKNQDALWEEV